MFIIAVNIQCLNIDWFNLKRDCFVYQYIKKY